MAIAFAGLLFSSEKALNEMSFYLVSQAPFFCKHIPVLSPTSFAPGVSWLAQSLKSPVPRALRVSFCTAVRTCVLKHLAISRAACSYCADVCGGRTCPPRRFLRSCSIHLWCGHCSCPQSWYVPHRHASFALRTAWQDPLCLPAVVSAFCLRSGCGNHKSFSESPRV